MCAKILNSAGLGLTLIGVLILFWFGMPFHVPTGGAVAFIAEQPDKDAIALERRYTIYGYIGLILLVVGTALQMIAIWIP
jgi:hypothetical protein